MATTSFTSDQEESSSSSTPRPMLTSTSQNIAMPTASRPCLRTAWNHPTASATTTASDAGRDRVRTPIPVHVRLLRVEHRGGRRGAGTVTGFDARVRSRLGRLSATTGRSTVSAVATAWFDTAGCAARSPWPRGFGLRRGMLAVPQLQASQVQVLELETFDTKGAQIQTFCAAYLSTRWDGAACVYTNLQLSHQGNLATILD